MSVPKDITPGANHATVVQFDGFSIQEDASAAAVIEFRKAVVGGQVIAYLNLAADETATIVFPKSISAEGGVYVKEVSGSVTGVLFSDE